MDTSVYESLGHFAKLQAVPEVKGALPCSDLRSVEPGALESALDVMGDLQPEHATCVERASHPWRGCLVRDGGVATSDRLMQALNAVCHERLARHHGVVAVS
jgi:hypothetical protein